MTRAARSTMKRVCVFCSRRMQTNCQVSCTNIAAFRISNNRMLRLENQVAQEFFNSTWMRSASNLLRTSLDSSSRINDLEQLDSRREKSEILSFSREVIGGNFHAEIPYDQQLSIATFLNRARRVLTCMASKWEKAVTYKMCWWFTEEH